MKPTEAIPSRQITLVVGALGLLTLLAGCASTPPLTHPPLAHPPPAQTRSASHPPSRPRPSVPLLKGILLDRVIAVVNGSPILQSSLDQEMNLLSHELMARHFTVPPRKIFRRQVLARMVQQKIELEAAHLHGIAVSDQHVSGVLAEIAARDRVPFDQFPEKLLREHINYMAFRNFIRNELIIHRMISTAVVPNVTVTKGEVEAWLRDHPMHTQVDYHLKDIRIDIPTARNPLTVQAAKNQAEALVTELKLGHSFSDIAVADSAGRNALKGGALGWKSADVLPASWRGALKNLPQGGITAPIATRRGFVILKLLGRKVTEMHPIFAREYRVRQIVIRPTPALPGTAVRQRLLKLRRMLMHGAHWRPLAKAYSDDPTVELNGGLLGWVLPKSLPTPYPKILSHLAVHQISQPFLTDNGWVITQVLGIRRHNVTRRIFTQRAYAILFERRLRHEAAHFLHGLIAEAFVHYLVPWAH